MPRTISSDPLTDRAGRYINTESPRPIGPTVSSSGYRVLMYWSDWVNKGVQSVRVGGTNGAYCMLDIEGFLGSPYVAARRVSGFCRRVPNS